MTNLLFDNQIAEGSQSSLSLVWYPEEQAQALI